MNASHYKSSHTDVLFMGSLISWRYSAPTESFPNLLRSMTDPYELAAITRRCSLASAGDDNVIPPQQALVCSLSTTNEPLSGRESGVLEGRASPVFRGEIYRRRVCVRLTKASLSSRDYVQHCFSGDVFSNQCLKSLRGGEGKASRRSGLTAPRSRGGLEGI